MDDENKGSVIAKIEDGNIFISLSEFKNAKYLDIRKYFEDDSGEWKPTKKGIALSKKQFAELLALLNEKKEEIQSLL